MPFLPPSFRFSSPRPRAEIELAVYGGANTNFGSEVKLHKGVVNDVRNVGWDGKSFDMPPYWGARATYWFRDFQEGWGLGLDYTHAKAYSDVNFGADPVYNHLEFTDGLNLAIVTGYYRFTSPSEARFVPYVGAGVGAAIPHVEVKLDSFPSQDTWNYQLAGPAAQIVAGAAFRLIGDLSVFAEGKLSYAHISADLTGGGTLETDIWSPQLAAGFSYRF